MKTLNSAETKEGRDFVKLVLWVSTLCIAAMAGFLASIRQINPSVHFQFSTGSVLAFLAGGALTYSFLRFVLAGNVRRRGLVVVAVAIALVVGYFTIGISHVSPDARRDVTIGTAIAVCALSFVAWLLWRMSRFFERDQRQNKDSAR